MRNRLHTNELKHPAAGLPQQEEDPIMLQQYPIPCNYQAQNQALAISPFLDQVSQSTAYMHAICNYHDVIKKWQTVAKDNYDQTQLYFKYNALTQLHIMEIPQCPTNIQDIDWRILPQELNNIAQYFSLVSGWSKMSVLVAMLGYISSAMRGRYGVLIRPEWFEAVILYQLMIASPGQNKSLVHRFMNAPLEKFQEKLMSKYLAKKASAQRHSETRKQAHRIVKMALLRQAMKNAQNDEEEINIDLFFKGAHEASEKLSGIPSPANAQLDSPAFLADGFTEKKLMRLMAGAGGGQAILQPEGTTLIRQIKDPKFDPKIFLKSYGMEDFYDGTVPSGTISVSGAFLNILVFLQPGIAAELYKNPKLISSGLSARFLPYFVPPTGAPCATPENLNAEAAAVYFRKLTSMLERNYTQESKREIFRIQLEPSARQEIENFQHELRFNNYLNSCHDSLKFFADKLAGTAARIAGIIHAWQFDEPEKYYISPQTMQAGIQIARAMLPQAEYALSPAGFQAVDDAKKILEWVRRHRHSSFTSRDIGQNSGVRTNDKIFPALDLLEQHNILTQLSVPNKPRMCLMHPYFT